MAVNKQSRHGELWQVHLTAGDDRNSLIKALVEGNLSF